MDGLQIISDGTDAGTYVLIDGHPMTGIVHVNWKLNPDSNAAEICFSLKDLSVACTSLPPEDLAKLESIIDLLPMLTGELNVAMGLRSAARR